jgi:glutathione S-transferase
LFVGWRRIYQNDESCYEAQRALIDPKFSIYYSAWNRILENSGGDYVLGSKLSHADFWLACWIDIWDGPKTDDMIRPVMPAIVPPPHEPEAKDFKENMSAGYKHLRAHKEKIMNIPQIKKWIAERPNTIM